MPRAECIPRFPLRTGRFIAGTHVRLTGAHKLGRVGYPDGVGEYDGPDGVYVYFDDGGSCWVAEEDLERVECRPDPQDRMVHLMTTAGYVYPVHGGLDNCRAVILKRLANGDIYGLEVIDPERPAAAVCETAHQFGSGETETVRYAPGLGWQSGYVGSVVERDAEDRRFAAAGGSE